MNKHRDSFLSQVLRRPERLRERLILAIALAPPKSRRASRSPKPKKVPKR